MSRETRYWQKTGLALGTTRYNRYLHLFGLDEDSLAGLTVCDFGCGPFGGVLSVLRGVKDGYPVDVLAATYNGWGEARFPIRPVNPATCETHLPGGVCDAVFCLNALDHADNATDMRAELFRIAKRGGTLYLFCHVRPATKGHRTMTVRRLQDLFQADYGWEWVSRHQGLDEPNEEPKLTAVWGVLRRC